MATPKDKIKIAIVDDQSLFRDGIVSLLDDEEFDWVKICMQAENGKTLIDSLKPGEMPDVILLDYEMPIMDGRQTTEYLKRHFPQIKILILTMYNDESLVYDLILKGAHGFLLKESKIEEIVEAIDEVTKSGYYFNHLVNTDMIGKLLEGNLINPHYKKADLSDREKEILKLICKQYTTREISEKLSLSLRTVDRHRNSLLKKIGAKNTAGLVMYAIKSNLHRLN